ncbi:MAG: type II secretion system F family protein [Deltaproteobacteria bacterium]|nr:type II secretion system F family protein [Deltaproteobacteria bacterium]
MLADNEEQLAVTLRGMDLYLVAARPEKAWSAIYITRPVKLREIINFTVHMSTSIGAGIPILQALEDVEQQTTNRRMQRAIRDITENLRGGSSYSDALARHPVVFGDVYVSMVRAGEASGTLDQVLERLVDFLEWQDALASEIRRASIYPAAVLVAVLALIGVLLGFVFPRILPVIHSLKVPLPFITRAVIAAGDFVRFGWFWILLGLAGLFALVRLLGASEGGRLIIDAVKLRIPVIGGLVEKICLSRFAHHLGLLLRTGVDITQSLSITAEVVGNTVIAQAVSEVREKVIQGGSLWRSLQETGAFPPLIVRMVFVGENTGTVDSSLEKVTAFYDREIPATVKKMFAIMEPLIIVILAGLVLMVALAIFVPLYDALGKVGRR